MNLHTTERAAVSKALRSGASSPTSPVTKQRRARELPTTPLLESRPQRDALGSRDMARLGTKTVPKISLPSVDRVADLQAPCACAVSSPADAGTSGPDATAFQREGASAAPLIFPDLDAFVPSAPLAEKWVDKLRADAEEPRTAHSQVPPRRPSSRVRWSRRRSCCKRCSAGRPRSRKSCRSSAESSSTVRHGCQRKQQRQTRMPQQPSEDFVRGSPGLCRSRRFGCKLTLGRQVAR